MNFTIDGIKYEFDVVKMNGKTQEEIQNRCFETTVIDGDLKIKAHNGTMKKLSVLNRIKNYTVDGKPEKITETYLDELDAEVGNELYLCIDKFDKERKKK